MGKRQRPVKRLKRLKAERASGRAAHAGQTRLTTHSIGVLPILNRILEQMKLEPLMNDALFGVVLVPALLMLGVGHAVPGLFIHSPLYNDLFPGRRWRSNFARRPRRHFPPERIR